MTDEFDPIEYGTVHEVLARLTKAYPSIREGEDINSKLLARDLIIIMKVSGKPKDQFLYNMGALWDDIEMESLQ